MKKTTTFFENTLATFLKTVRKTAFSEKDMQDLDKIITRLEWYQIAVVGKPGLGKSTFFNALIGQQLLPSSGGDATTGVPTYIYHNTEGTKVEIVFKDGKKQAIEPTQTTIAQYINSVNQQRTDIKEIRIETPIRFVTNSGFKGKFCLIDTPGEGTVAAKEHSEITRELIKQADAIIVLNEQRQLNTTDVDFLSNEIKKVRTDLRQQDIDGEVVFDNKLLICLNKIDLDERYVKSGDFAPKRQITAELLKQEGLQIKPNNISGLAAEPALLCLLIQRTMGKEMKKINIDTIEQYEKIQKRGSIIRDNASKLKTYLDDIANKRQLDDPSLQLLFDMTLLSNFETNLLQHLQGDLKTPPLRKALTLASDMAQKQIDAYNTDLGEANKQLEAAIKVEKEKRQEQEKHYSYEKSRIEGQKAKIELLYEREKSGYKQEIEKNNHLKDKLRSDYKLQLPGFNAQKDAIAKELPSLNAYSIELKNYRSERWSHYSTSKYVEDNCGIDGWGLNCGSSSTKAEDAVPIYNKLKSLNSELQGKYLIISKTVRFKLAQQQKAILSLFNNLISNSATKTQQKQYLLLDYEEKALKFLDIAYWKKYLRGRKDEGRWALKHYLLNYTNNINTTLAKQDIDNATDSVCAYINSLVSNYQTILTEGFDTLIKLYKEEVDKKVTALEDKNKALRQKIEELDSNKNNYIGSLNTELANFVAPNTSAAPLETEQINDLKARISSLESTRDSFKKETVDVFADLLEQLKTK